MIRKHATSPMLESTREMSRNSREDAARQLFAWKAVEEAIRGAAGKGFDQVEMVPPLPLDLRRTEAARALCDKLARLGFQTHWEERIGPRPGEAGQVLGISWRSAKPDGA